MTTSTASFARNRFSTVGRHRKDGLRELNGRLQRQPKAETEAEIVSLVLRQPHREGSRSQWRATLIGRLLDGGDDAKVKHSDIAASELYEAAERYARDYARAQAALASRRPLAVTGGGVLRPESDPEQDQRAIDNFQAASRALRGAGERVEKAVDAVCLHSAPECPADTLATWVLLSLPAGLGALCLHYGLSGKAPVGAR